MKLSIHNSVVFFYFPRVGPNLFRPHGYLFNDFLVSLLTLHSFSSYLSSNFGIPKFPFFSTSDKLVSDVFGIILDNFWDVVKLSHGRPKRKWKDIAKMDLKGTECDNVEWFHQAKDSVQQ